LTPAGKRIRGAAALAVFAAALAITSSPGGANAQSAKTTLVDPAQAEAFNRVSNRLICQCSCQMVVRVCNHQNCPSAIPIRREIERQILDGTGEDEIVQSFVDEYGLKVLSSPPAEGFNLAVWVMPGFALLVGLGIVLYLAATWAGRRRTASATAASAPGLDPEARRRIEEALSKKD